jgi:polyhydroxyalkanoate synthesis regulator phasin
MSWNYAELSKAAKNFGGPEKYADTLVKYGKHTGRKEMIPIVGVALGLGAIGYAGVQNLVARLKKKEELSTEAARQAKEALIQNIKNYDETHPDNEGERAETSKEDIADVEGE